MRVTIKLYPPLNTAAGRSDVELDVDGPATLRAIIDQLCERFGQVFRGYLFDDKGAIIPAWCVFINDQRPTHCNRSGALETPVADGDKLSFLLALAGG